MRSPARRTRLENLNKLAIQEAVVRILTDQGSSALTMDNVAAEAGMAKGTLYASFDHKDQLIEWVRSVTLDPLREATAELLDSDRPPAAKLRELILLTLRYFDEKRGPYRVLLWQRHHELVQKSRRQASPKYRAHVGRVAAVLEAGVAAGDFRPLDAARVAPVVIEATSAFVAERLFGNAPRPVEADAELLIDLLLHGLAAEPTPAPRRGQSVRKVPVPRPRRPRTAAARKS